MPDVSLEIEHKLMKSAIRLLGEKGSETTLAEIAKDAKVSSASTYRFFKTKENAVVRMHNLFWNHTLNNINSADNLSWTNETTAIKKIDHLIHLTNIFIAKEKDLVKAVSKNIPPAPEDIKDITTKKIRLESRQSHKKFLDKLDEIIIEGQESGYIKKELSPIVIRHILIGSLQEIMRNIHFGKKTQLLDSRQATQAVKLLMGSICTDKNKSTNQSQPNKGGEDKG